MLTVKNITIVAFLPEYDGTEGCRGCYETRHIHNAEGRILHPVTVEGAADILADLEADSDYEVEQEDRIRSLAGERHMQAVQRKREKEKQEAEKRAREERAEAERIARKATADEKRDREEYARLSAKYGSTL